MFKFNLVSSLLLTLFIMPVAQANVSWSFDPGVCTDCGGALNSEGFGNVHSYEASSGSNNVTVSAFSTTSDINGASGADAFETAQLTQWGGGFGVRSREDGSISNVPDHAIDNNSNDGNNPEQDRGDVDVIQFSFNVDTSLDGVEIGYKSGDSDITVLAHNGSGDKSLLGKTFAQLLSNGWGLIGHYSNLAVNTPKTINTGGFFSSDWLIAAYTPEAGGVQTWSFGNDYFKLSGLSGAGLTSDNPDQGEVPEPSSIALLFLGLIGWKMSSKKSKKSIVNVEQLLVA